MFLLKPKVYSNYRSIRLHIPRHWLRMARCHAVQCVAMYCMVTREIGRDLLPSDALPYAWRHWTHLTSSILLQDTIVDAADRRLATDCSLTSLSQSMFCTYNKRRTQSHLFCCLKVAVYWPGPIDRYSPWCWDRPLAFSSVALWLVAVWMRSRQQAFNGMNSDCKRWGHSVSLARWHHGTEHRHLPQDNEIYLVCVVCRPITSSSRRHSNTKH